MSSVRIPPLGPLLGPSWGSIGAFLRASLNFESQCKGTREGEGDSQASHTPFHLRQAGVGGPVVTVVFTMCSQTTKRICQDSAIAMYATALIKFQRFCRMLWWVVIRANRTPQSGGYVREALPPRRAVTDQLTTLVTTC